MADIQWLDSSSTVDRDAAGPRGKPCDACGTPIEPLDKFCPACGTTNPDFSPPISASPSPSKPATTTAAAKQPVDASVVAEPPEQKHFQCETCGAEVATDPDQRSYVCPFCDSTYVVEVPTKVTGRQQPE